MKIRAIFIVFLLITVSCSTKKDGFFPRAYHSTTSKFNPLFNGQEALRYGVLDLTQKHQDNYWERLQVDPFALPDSYDTEKTTNEFFDRAEEKAILTVQKHSMLIRGEQKNNQIAKAYLLLGQARYYNGRYLQAVEAFSHLIKNINDPEEVVKAEFWRAKTYLAMGQHDRAVRELSNIAQSAKLKTQQYALVQAALADALLIVEEDSLATKPLYNAFATEKSAERRGRYAYLLGQLYEELHYSDSAEVAYQQVVDLNRRLPREMWIHARLAQLKNKTPNDENTMLSYQKLLRSDEDRRFRDKIHYFYGAYLLKGGDTLSSENEFHEVLRANTNDVYLKSLVYEQFAMNRFDQVAYLDAAAYLDSTLQNLTADTRRYRKLNRQRHKLDDIITYDKTIAETDSLLSLMHMSAEQQKEWVDNHIAALRKAKQKANALEKELNAAPKESMGNFYFYNTRQVDVGKQDFQRNWSNIALADNWKYTPVQSNTIVITEEKSSEADIENAVFHRETYLSRIPPLTAQDSIVKLQQEAYFQAGLAYKEQFAVKKTAIERFTSLLESNPAARYLPPTFYHMYELHKGSQIEQDHWRNRILNEYPESDYAKMLQNPAALVKNNEDNKAKIKAAKVLFDDQKYQEVITQSEKQIPQLTNKELQAEWALLRATSLGRLDGLDAYKKALTTLVETYPKTKIKDIAQSQLDGFAVYNDIDTTNDTSAKLVFVRTPQERNQSLEDKLWIEEWLKKEGVEERLVVSIDVFDRTTETLVIHGFTSEKGAKETLSLMGRENAHLLTSKNVVILASGYRNALIHKRLGELVKK